MKRHPYVADRLLFGPMECRVGGCRRDGVCQVALPYITFGGPPLYQGTEGYTVISMCEKHAREEVEKGRRKGRRK